MLAENINVKSARQLLVDTADVRGEDPVVEVGAAAGGAPGAGVAVDAPVVV